MSSTSSNPFGAPTNFRSNGQPSTDYPTSARDTLLRVESMILGKKQDLCFELIAEFVFLEKSGGRGVANSNINTISLIQEYQLVVVLCEFFMRSGTDVSKNAVFLSLFGDAVNPSVSRARVLVKLISTAVSGTIIPVLKASGTWMQQMGTVSPASLGLAQRLIDDFINFSKTCPEQLKALPSIAPRFTLNFMSSATELYLHDTTSPYPPPMLLDVITNWLTQHPALFMATQPPLALPPGAIPMQLVTPMARLIKWCVVAPIHQQKAIDSEKFAHLHLSILQCLSKAATPFGTINAISLSSITLTIQRSTAAPEAIQTSIERLALAIQLALTNRSITGNIPQLFIHLESLPPNPLMQIVIKSQKTFVSS